MADKNRRAGAEDAGPVFFFFFFSSFCPPTTGSKKKKRGINPRKPSSFSFSGADLSFVDAHDSMLLLQKYTRPEQGAARSGGGRWNAAAQKITSFPTVVSARAGERESLSRFLPGCHMIPGRGITGGGRKRFPPFSSSRRFTVK